MVTTRNRYFRTKNTYIIKTWIDDEMDLYEAFYCTLEFLSFLSFRSIAVSFFLFYSFFSSFYHFLLTSRACILAFHRMFQFRFISWLLLYLKMRKEFSFSVKFMRLSVHPAVMTIMTESYDGTSFYFYEWEVCRYCDLRR